MSIATFPQDGFVALIDGPIYDSIQTAMAVFELDPSSGDWYLEKILKSPIKIDGRPALRQLYDHHRVYIFLALQPDGGIKTYLSHIDAEPAPDAQSIQDFWKGRPNGERARPVLRSSLMGAK